MDLPGKVSRVQMMVLFLFVLIFLRVWHLAYVQYDEQSERAFESRKKMVVTAPKRGTIRDRFNHPFAVNKLKYQAAIVYSEIQQIPAVCWQKNEEGQRVRVPRRREYVGELAELLEGELGLDKERIVDLVYSKAVFLHSAPYVIKDDITEQEYYRLRAREKDFPGLQVRKSFRRDYPEGRVAADVIGTIGSINANQYHKLLGEMATLKQTLKNIEEDEEFEFPEGLESTEDIRDRITLLQEKSYTFNDLVGKTGIESSFEQNLRGRVGKKTYFTDARGNYLEELPGQVEAASGERLLLTLSSELQAYAEELLVAADQMRRDGEHSNPWIRGGAIVALDPKSGEVLALAGVPRFDPNDFIAHSTENEEERTKNLRRWLEGRNYVRNVWDQIQPLFRENYHFKSKKLYDDEHILTWSLYLDLILPGDNPVRSELDRYSTLNKAVAFQQLFDTLRFENQEEIKALLPQLPFEYVTHPQDQLLFIDLLRLSCEHTFFSDELLEKVGGTTLAEYRDQSAALSSIERMLRSELREPFRAGAFAEWREKNEKSYLAAKRRAEKEAGSYQKPYLDYIDRVERDQFHHVWERSRVDLILALLTGKFPKEMEGDPLLLESLKWHEELASGAHSGASWYQDYLRLRRVAEQLPFDQTKEYLTTMRSYDALNRPLIGRYPGVYRSGKVPLEKDLAASFYPRYGYGFQRSPAYRRDTTIGSAFKLVTAYAALMDQKRAGKSGNPLLIRDHHHFIHGKLYLGHFTSGEPIPRMYKGGRLPKSLSKNIGETDLTEALGRSSNPYFALLSVDVLSTPDLLREAALDFSYGRKTGLALPGEYAGTVPDDLETNRTNLYSTSIGQGTLAGTPIQTAVMMTALARGGEVIVPKIVSLRVDETVEPEPLEIRRTLELPQDVQAQLFEGMKRVIERTHNWTIQQYTEKMPSLYKDYLEMKPYMIGKTSSSESNVRVHLDRQKGLIKETHGWFSALIFPEKVEEAGLTQEPELVVVVYLPFARGGKQAMPFAASIARKWRSIASSTDK